MNAKRRTRTEGGQTLVEMAIVLPVLLLVLFAIIHIGIVFHNYLALTDAVRVGARKGAVSRELPDPTGATIAAVENAATDLGADLDVDVDTPGGWTPGSDVTVTATYPYDINIIGWVIAAGSLSSSTTERIN